MELGAFSVSLNVKDIKQSFDFYQKLGFTQMGGDIDQNWLILKNGDTVIGLFQGMFEKNMLTFNQVGTKRRKIPTALTMCERSKSTYCSKALH